MENIQPPRDSGYGPRPAAPRRGPQVRLTAQRAAVLDQLSAQPERVSVAALADAAGLHPNTVREHLDALVDAGLAERSSARPVGRGRPAWLYRGVEPAEPAAREYAGLASALAAQIARSSEEPTRDALEAGRAWGRELAAESGEQTITPAEGRRRVITLLEDLGFAPEPNGRSTQARLTRCPLLTAAQRHPEIVCQVHLGIVQGALEALGTPADQVQRTDLIPFAEPGACRLHLLTRPEPDRP